MLNRNKKKGKKNEPQVPNNNQIQNSNNILSNIGSAIINKIPNLKVPNLDININDYFQSSSFINENSVSKGYRSFLDGFNRNIIGKNKYSDYNTEFIRPYFPQDIIDSLTIKEGKYDIIGIFNGECLVYNKHDKKVESHNCELTNKKMKELEAAAKIQEMDRRRMASNQVQQPMIEAAPELPMIEDAPEQLMVEAAPEQLMVEDAPQQLMVEDAPQERLMIEAAPPPRQPIPMLSLPSAQNLSQFNGLLPQIKFPTTISLPPDKPSQNDYEPTLLIENNQPQASQQQEQQLPSMGTGSQESQQQQQQTNMNTDSEIVDVMKKYTTGNINKNISNDILNLGEKPIDESQCKANKFITANMCASGKVNRKSRLIYSPDKNFKCKAYADDRFKQHTNFCENEKIPDEYKDPTVYKKKYNDAVNEIEAASKPATKVAPPTPAPPTPAPPTPAPPTPAPPTPTPSAKEETTQPKQTSTETKPLLITNGPQTPETKHLAITNGQQSNVVNRFGNAANRFGNTIGNTFGNVAKSGKNAANKLGNTVINLGNTLGNAATKRVKKPEVLLLTNKSSTTSDKVAPTSQTVTTTPKPKQAWGENTQDNEKQKEIKQANDIKKSINPTLENKKSNETTQQSFIRYKKYLSAINNKITDSVINNFGKFNQDESKKIITDHIKGLITNIKSDFNTLNNKDIENDADKGIRKETRTNLESLETKLLAKMNIYDADIVKFINNIGNIDNKILDYDNKKAAAEEKAKANAKTTPQPASESILENEGRKVQSIDDVAENANLYSFFNPGDNNNSTQGGKKVNKTKKSKKSKKNHQKKQGRKTRKKRS
jgi:hypothetical protein